MKNTRHAIAAAALLAGCLLGGGAALAQGGPPMGRGSATMPMMPGYGPGANSGYGYGMMQGYGMMSGAGMMPGWGMMGGHTAGMLAFIKAEIGVTAAQETQWNSFAAALQAMADDMHAAMYGGGKPDAIRPGAMMGDRGQAEALPDALAARVRWMSSHLAALKNLQAAAGPFYAALDAGQKAKADALLGCGFCGR
ncbi:Spy/CpxP family protein refolding chaperone [Ferrovibrio xuzhouensis]|uniref:Spy/CpxP family protein refolding chaperone n=1 Tax=Ferrovibrio xuzhouensis TaxID=1576914 RepID=A0ABV7VAZ8_9PROT